MKLFSVMTVLALFALPANAADVDSAAKDIVGAWRLDFTTPDDVKMTPTVIVGRQHDELVAWYIGKENKIEAFKDVHLKDDALLLTIVPEERGGEVTVTFEAKLKEDGACHGEAEYTTNGGDSGQWEFTGRRMAAADFDEATKWKLTFVTPDGEQREALVTVASRGEKLYAWYSSKRYELPAKKISMDGEKVVMAMTVKTRDGAKVDVTFSGTVDGERVAGEVEYDLEGETGSFPFQGNRQS